MRICFAPAILTAIVSPAVATADGPAPVSYFKDIRPIFQQHCNGCHQPAKPMGGYVMTAHAALLKSGERGKPGIVPHKPGESYLLEQIKHLENGKAEMPKGRDPLTAQQIKLITDWVAQGAVDDTPASAKAVAVDAKNPPKYMAPPVITSLAFSPDGNRLAVTGYHEILLYDTETYKLQARLVGISERVQSIAFSPDGSKLAAVGGAPGLYGEVQVWLPDTGKLLLSVPYTFDTLYGASWSPDGKMLAFGCADNTVRAIDPLTGKQLVRMGTHSDWVLGTVFSQDGAHLVSVSRDMTMKLTEVDTQRFIDDVTSITPGALKGGLMAVDRRPTKERRITKVPQDEGGKFIEKVYDEVIAAGADGTPRLYKIHRETKRVIGDDANKIREYERMPGRISSVAFNPEGSTFAAGSSLDGKGEVRVYNTQTGAKIVCKDVTGPVYAVTWHPDGKRIASAGFDGIVWIHEAATGQLVEKFTVLPR